MEYNLHKVSTWSFQWVNLIRGFKDYLSQTFFVSILLSSSDMSLENGIASAGFFDISELNLLWDSNNYVRNSFMIFKPLPGSSLDFQVVFWRSLIMVVV